MYLVSASRECGWRIQKSAVKSGTGRLSARDDLEPSTGGRHRDEEIRGVVRAFDHLEAPATRVVLPVSRHDRNPARDRAEAMRERLLRAAGNLLRRNVGVTARRDDAGAGTAVRDDLQFELVRG